MPSDREFLNQRLALVEQFLTNPGEEVLLAGRSRGHRLSGSSGRRRQAYKREARLLRELLARTREGQVLTVLTTWQGNLRIFRARHRERYKRMQDAYDDWWRLPWEQRADLPRPPRPPLPRYVDREGIPWVVDDRFMATLGDLIERLQRWLDDG